MQFEESAEGACTHACKAGHVGETYLVLIVLADVILYLEYPAAITCHIDLGKAARRQGACTVAARELVEDSEELLEGVEAILNTAERVELLVDLHDGIHREAESLLGFYHHLAHRVEGVAPKDAAVAEIEVELYGHLTDILTGAFILLPDMLQVWAGDEHQIVVANHLARVAHYTAHTGSVLYEIEFVDLVVMDGIGKLFFPTVSDVEHILAHQRGNLMNNLRLFHLIIF